MVLCVRYRKQLLFVGDGFEFLKDVCKGIWERYWFEFDSIGTDGDYVHILVGAAPRYAPSKMMQIIGSITARQLFKRYPEIKQQLWGGEFWSDSGYCDKTRNGKFEVGKKTSRKKFRQKMEELNLWLKQNRNADSRKWWPILRSKLTGHYLYFGISGNYEDILRFYKETVKYVFKWINRRSQKKSYSWEKFCDSSSLTHYQNLESIIPTPVEDVLLKSLVREILKRGSVRGFIAASRSIPQKEVAMGSTRRLMRGRWVETHCSTLPRNLSWEKITNSILG